MRLRSAIDLDDYEDTVSGFGDRVSREARRERRRRRKSDRRDDRADRRDGRREFRQERRLDRVERKQDQVRDKLARAPGGGPLRRRSPATEPTLQPAPNTRDPRREGGWVDDVLDRAVDYFDDEFAPDDEGDDGEDVDQGDDGEDRDDATEGIGAWRPFRRTNGASPPSAETARRPFRRTNGASALSTETARRPFRRTNGASPPPAGPRGPSGSSGSGAQRAPTGDGAWGPSVRLGRKLRIQAAVGHRAAVIDLKPGLYLVAELPEAVTRTEFGLAPVLAPLMVTAARRALDEPPRERRGPLASLFRRRREEPVRYVQLQPVPQSAPAPLALPGPVADESQIVAAPNVGWADDATVAAAYGCDCDRSRR